MLLLLLLLVVVRLLTKCKSNSGNWSFGSDNEHGLRVQRRVEAYAGHTTLTFDLHLRKA